ncbi:Uncharacterised protein [Enterobacter hormaechei]|nr:Uncharacterised protein [Enterobacter hormaechei]
MAVTEYGWHPEVAAKFVRFTPSQHRGALRYRIFDVLTHFLDSRRLNQRADNDALVQTVTHLQRLHRIGKLIDELVIDRLLNIETVYADADLPGVTELIGDRAFDGGINIRVLENDIRRITAQLHRYLFHGLCGIANQRFPDGG